MVSTAFPIITFFKALQHLNAPFSIVITESGMTILSRFSHPLKVLLSIVFLLLAPHHSRSTLEGIILVFFFSYILNIVYRSSKYIKLRIKNVYLRIYILFFLITFLLFTDNSRKF